MTDDILLDQVRQLRQRGMLPKQIARTLGMTPSAVAPLIRQVATLDQTNLDPAERPLLGCWISPGWSYGLGLEEAPRWRELDPFAGAAAEAGGLVSVLIARKERASRAVLCGYLVDVFCLGVKNAIGPTVMSDGAVTDFRRNYYRAYGPDPASIPVELGQHVVHGAVDYARRLGFEPHADFAAVAPYLGSATTPCLIRFGREGRPCFISGPYDNSRAVITKLRKAVGEKNFDILARI